MRSTEWDIRRSPAALPCKKGTSYRASLWGNPPDTSRTQHGFTKGKSCFTNLISFYDEMTGLTDEMRAVDIVYLDIKP